MSDVDMSRTLLEPLPITEGDADRLDELRDTLNEELEGARVSVTDYAKAELTLELTDVDEETEESRTNTINEEYEWMMEHCDTWDS